MATVAESPTAENAVAIVTRALRIATDGSPGPVHVECPGEVAATVVAPPGSNAGARGVAKEGEYSKLDAFFAKARKPLLLAGLGAVRGLADLCERHHVPAMVTYKAKGVVPDDHPWFGGVFTNATIEQPLIEESDLSIGVGLDIKQQARKLPADGVALGGIDWQAIARGFGMTAFVASDRCGLERAIDAAYECRGPSLIEARIDRSNYGETMRAVRG